MRLVSIVASQPIEKKIGSELIMFELKTDYSHVSWIFWNTDRSKPRYYEAVLHGGVKFTGQKQWEARNKVMFRKDFEIPEFDYDAFLDSAMDKCGIEYSFWQNVGIKLKSIFALSRNLFSNGDDESNCSELIYDFKDFVKLKVDETDPDLVTPRQIVEACRGAA